MTCVCITTADDVRTLPALVRAVLEHTDHHVLISDAGSADGSARVAHRMAEVEARVDVLLERPLREETEWLEGPHRASKTARRHRGRATARALAEAARRGHEVAVEMSADFSHLVQDIDALLKVAWRADVVSGIRFGPGATLEARALSRGLLYGGSRVLARLAGGPSDLSVGMIASSTYRR